MVIATHRDMVSEEDFETKDRLLQKKIKCTECFKKDVVRFASKDQLMIVGEMEETLEKVINESFPAIPIPASWLMLSLYLRWKNFRTVKLDQCENIAVQLGISSEKLQDALLFLHHQVGALLYYPELGRAIEGLGHMPDRGTV